MRADGPVDLVVTEAATFAVDDDVLVLVEVADGFTEEWVAANTTAAYRTTVGSGG